MRVLDTDHMSLAERAEGQEGPRLRARIKASQVHVVTTIISFEEQTRGWLAYLSKAQSVVAQIEAYARLNRMLDNYRRFEVLPFTERAAVEFQELRGMRLRVGTMDLKIAAIVLAHDATLLTRNRSDFLKIPRLKVEDWTRPD